MPFRRSPKLSYSPTADRQFSEADAAAGVNRALDSDKAARPPRRLLGAAPGAKDHPLTLRAVLSLPARERPGRQQARIGRLCRGDELRTPLHSLRPTLVG